MTATRMLAEARRDLGLAGRPNRITRSYAERHGGAFLRAPWCNQAVTEWARRSGNAAAVLPAGDRAYTVWHAEDGEQLNRWYAGTAENIRKHARPGAIVFFDWGGSDRIGYIDHVGIVEKNLGDGRVQTIEGNTADACKRRVRSASVIAGFWNPDYSIGIDEMDGTAAKQRKKEAEAAVKIVLVDGVPQWPGRTLKLTSPMMSGADVRLWQEKLAKRGWTIEVDGKYGKESRAVARGYRKATGLRAGDVVDRATWEMTWSWRPPEEVELDGSA